MKVKYQIRSKDKEDSYNHYIQINKITTPQNDLKKNPKPITRNFAIN